WLTDNEFIRRYVVDGKPYIQVVMFWKHQNPHYKEPPSTIPPEPKTQGIRVNHRTETLGSALNHGASSGGKPSKGALSPPTGEGQTGLIPDSGFLTPDSGSLIPDSPSRRRPSVDNFKSESEIHQRVEAIKRIYPKAARQDWITAEKLIRNLVMDGTRWEDITAGVTRYAKLCAATNRRAQNPGLWFGAVDRPWLQEWPIPASNGKGHIAKPSDEAAWAEAKSLAGEIGFRDPFPAETASSYMIQVKQARDRPPDVPLSERRGLAGIKRIGSST
ncbi:MAG TPA: hypothetical protein VKT80_17415, partial [Chloroflexota bacterium]|nr:hypothetical protein [Chloroflexota bacterium]